MATKNYENGIIGTSEGGSGDISEDIIVTGNIYYVDSANGSDANAGTNRNYPKATTSSALSAATANNGDIIIWESGHTETFDAMLTLSKAGVGYYGLGSGASRPTFITNNVNYSFYFSAARCVLHNVIFSPTTTATSFGQIDIGASGVRIYNCTFNEGALDTSGVHVQASANDNEINGCTFTVQALGAQQGVLPVSATTLGLKVIGCQFDGGDFGFVNGGIYSTVAHTEYLYRDNTLTNKAHIIHTAASKGICVGTIADDGCRVEV